MSAPRRTIRLNVQYTTEFADLGTKELLAENRKVRRDVEQTSQTVQREHAAQTRTVGDLGRATAKSARETLRATDATDDLADATGRVVRQQTAQARAASDTAKALRDQANGRAEHARALRDEANATAAAAREHAEQAKALKAEGDAGRETARAHAAQAKELRAKAAEQRAASDAAFAEVRALRAQAAEARSSRDEHNRRAAALKDEAAALKGVEVNTRLVERSYADLHRAGRNSARGQRQEVQSLDRAFASLNTRVMAVRNTARTLRLPAGLAAAGLGIQQAGALGASAVSLTSAVGPSAGLLGAGPGLAASGVQGLAVVKGALAGVTDALGGLNDQVDVEKFDKLNAPAQALVSTLDHLKGTVRDIQGDAQRGLIPGLTDALDAAAPLAGPLRTIAGQTGTAIGDVARRAGRMAGTEQFGSDLTIIGGQNVQTIRQAGTATLNLSEAARDLMVTAGPLQDRIGRFAVRLSNAVAAETAAGRETGRLADFFDRSGDRASELVDIAGNLGGVLFNIADASSEAGEGLIESLERTTARWKSLTDDAGNQDAMASYFDQSAENVREAGRLIEDIGAALGRISNQPGMQVILSEVRTELVPAVEHLVTQMSAVAGPDVVRGYAAVADLLADMAPASAMTARALAATATAVSDIVDFVPYGHELVGVLLAAGIATKGLSLLGGGRMLTGMRALVGLSSTYQRNMAAAAAGESLTGGGLTGALGRRDGNRLRQQLGKRQMEIVPSVDWRDMDRQVTGRQSRVKRLGRTVGSWLGMELGARAAVDAGEGIVAPGRMTGALGGPSGRMRTIGRTAGTWIGRGLITGTVAGFVLALPFLADELRKELQKVAEDMGVDKTIRDVLINGPLVNLSKATGIDLPFGLGRRGGGRIGFREGGMVPVAVSPGELVTYGNSSWTVPGARVAADNVHTELPVGAMVFTDHGQQLLSQGYSADQALALQRPHFRLGGVTPDLAANPLGQLPGKKPGPSPEISGDTRGVAPWRPPSAPKQTIWRAGTATSVEPKYLWGVYGAETNFGRNVTTSGAGAQGPFQFMPATADSYISGGRRYINDFTRAAYGAGRYLRDLLRQFGDIKSAIGHYNSGPGGNLTNKETAAYIPKVLKLAETYDYAGPGRGGSSSTAGGSDLSGDPGSPGFRRVSLRPLGAKNARRAVRQFQTGLIKGGFGVGYQAGLSGTSPYDDLMPDLLSAARISAPRVGKRDPSGIYANTDDAGAPAGKADVKGSKPGFSVLMDHFRRMYGNELYVLSGNRPGSTVAGSGRVSNHADGNAIDITNRGLEQASAARRPETLNAAGAARMDRLNAYITRAIPRPPKRDHLWRTDQGGNHWNHIHLGMDPSVTSTVGAARKFVQTLPAGGHLSRRIGGRIGLRSGGQLTLPDDTAVGRATQRVARLPSLANTRASRSIKNIGTLVDDVEDFTWTQLVQLERAIKQQVAALAAGGYTRRERVQVNRLRAVLGLLDVEAGRRVGDTVRQIDAAVAALATRQTHIDQRMRLGGGVPKGITVGEVSQADELATVARGAVDPASGVGQLTAAIEARSTYDDLVQRAETLRNDLPRARGRGADEDAQDIAARLQEVRGQIRESFVTYIEASRATVVALSQERIDRVQFGREMNDAQTRYRVATGQVAQDDPSIARGQAAYLTAEVVPALDAALVVAKSVGDQQRVRELQLQIMNTIADAAELSRQAAEQARQAAIEAVQRRMNEASGRVEIARGQVTGIETWHRLNRTAEPDAMLDQARGINEYLLPVLRAQEATLATSYRELVAQGDLEAAHNAYVALQASGVDIANALIESADLIRDAAVKAAQIAVDAAQYDLDLSNLGFEELQIRQQLAGTAESYSAAEERATFIRDEIVPDQQRAAAALEEARRTALEQFGADSQQYRTADLDWRRAVLEVLKSQLSAQEETTEATERLESAMREYAGTLGYEYEGERFTDDLFRAGA